MKVTRLGFDIAKRLFQVHGVDENGKVKARKTLAREKVLEYFAQLPACLIGMEACGGAHYWGRELSKLGHTVKLMAAQFVIPYRKRGKNDANDAEAICEAVGRPNMHFVAIKIKFRFVSSTKLLVLPYDHRFSARRDRRPEPAADSARRSGALQF